MLSDCPSRPPARSRCRRGGLLPRRAAQRRADTQRLFGKRLTRRQYATLAGRPARRRWKWAPGGASSTSSSAGRPSGCSRRCCSAPWRGRAGVDRGRLLLSPPEPPGEARWPAGFPSATLLRPGLGRGGREETFADRRAEDRGYYHWPRFGFDGPLPAALGQRLPQQLAAARSVLDLIETKAGRRWWRRYGVALTVCFDLADESRSWRVFRRHLDAAPN